MSPFSCPWGNPLLVCNLCHKEHMDTIYPYAQVHVYAVMIQSSSMVHKLQCICTYGVADWIAIHTADSTTSPVVQRPYNYVGALQRTMTQHTATHYNNDSIKSSGAAPISGRCLLVCMYIVHLRCSLLQCVAMGDCCRCVCTSYIWCSGILMLHTET